MKKLIILLLLCGKMTLHAQDIIVKNDQTEIKVKVAEITEATIKYRKWDNLDGPLYNMAKIDVFMIIYANGKRETIVQQVGKNATEGGYRSKPMESSASTNVYGLNHGSTPNVDTVINYKKIRVKYAPSRFTYWFDSPPTTLGISSQLRLIKNVLNLGSSVDYFFITGAEETMYSVYLSPYLPLNRLTKNYQNQDKGLFIYGKLGYASISYTVDGESESIGNMIAGIGMDYFFTKHIGLNFSADKFGDGKFSLKGGISFK